MEGTDEVPVIRLYHIIIQSEDPFFRFVLCESTCFTGPLTPQNIAANKCKVIEFGKILFNCKETYDLCNFKEHFIKFSA
jgi:hypothetical protein